MTELWYLLEHAMQYNVTLYIQKSISENAPNVVLGVEEYEHFLGDNVAIHITYDPHRTFCHRQLPVISPHSI